MLAFLRRLCFVSLEIIGKQNIDADGVIARYPSYDFTTRDVQKANKIARPMVNGWVRELFICPCYNELLFSIIHLHCIWLLSSLSTDVGTRASFSAPHNYAHHKSLTAWKTSSFSLITRLKIYHLHLNYHCTKAVIDILILAEYLSQLNGLATASLL